MPKNYFSKFPVIKYNNVDCVNIATKIAINDELRFKTNAFYPYDVMEGLRPDHIADAYYQDPTLDWLIFLSTEIVDPYYGWPLDENMFTKFIETKYGSVDWAQQKVKFWRMHWESEYKKLTPSYFQSLPDPLKKYWKPLFGATGAIVQYERKEQDYTVNTNKIIRFTVNTHTLNSLSNGEFVDFKRSGEIVGTAEVYTANSSEVIVYHVSGNTSANVSHPLTLIGETTLANATANSSTLVVQTISDDEFAYWSSVSIYDYEKEINEQRKTIAVMRNDLVADTIEEITLKLMDQ
jgi:hypothetical protein